MKAKWIGKTIAESDKTIIIENNHYFPPDSVNWDYLQASSHSSVCPWKGIAEYHDVVVDGQTNINAAWYYPDPSEKAKEIQNYIAFWRGVEITD